MKNNVYNIEMTGEIYSYIDYRKYLKLWFSLQPGKGRGQRTALATAIGSPPSHVSQVLAGVSELSAEQVEKTSRFLGHTDEQAEYFDLLVRFARAGTNELKERLRRQVQRTRDQRLQLAKRLEVKNAISLDKQNQYYSSWEYAAVHIIVTIKKYSTTTAIAQALNLSSKRINEILSFLVASGLVEQAAGSYSVGTARLHITNDQLGIIRHHTNWRLYAIRALERDDMKEALHYSSVVSLSESDARRIHELLIQSINNAKTMIRDSSEEKLYSFCMDFFCLV